jgi:hypothetical protein
VHGEQALQAHQAIHAKKRDQRQKSQGQARAYPEALKQLHT